MKATKRAPDEYRQTNGRRRHADKRTIEAEKVHRIRREFKAKTHAVKLEFSNKPYSRNPQNIDRLGVNYVAAFYGRQVSMDELLYMQAQSTAHVNLIDDPVKPQQEERRAKPIKLTKAEILAGVSEVGTIDPTEWEALNAGARDPSGVVKIVSNPKPAPQRVRKAAA